jgi:hypothetical protein
VISTTPGTKRMVPGGLSAVDQQKIFESHAMKVYPRLKDQIARQATAHAQVR